jgi:hypothetical protein
VFLVRLVRVSANISEKLIIQLPSVRLFGASAVSMNNSLTRFGVLSIPGSGGKGLTPEAAFEPCGLYKICRLTPQTESFAGKCVVIA